jgi:16S rRNA (guanine527-N7)-methyltransferase
MALALLGSGWRPRIARVVAEVAGKSGHGAVLPADKLDRLALFHDRVVEWNARTDLTAARDPDELVDLLVADAAVLARHAGPPGARWVDVGSGAGAPGLPLAILCPELELTLVEPKTKRVAFLRSVAGALDLARVHVERARAEDLPRASWQTAISRATLPAAEWLALGARLATDRIWVFLARNDPPELPGWGISRDIEYRWPLSGAERRAVCFSRAP